MRNINELLSELTIEEKASLCSGASMWSTKPIKRLGISHINMFDGPHGLRGLDKIDAFDIPNKAGTCFPTASALASSWSRELISEVANALAEEAIDHNVHILLGTGTNIKRHPLGGRNFEYFSEDPYLAGVMAATYINNVQKNGVGTSLKHFTANNQETQRFSISAEISERALREIYLPAFEKAVKEAQPWTVMCAYNKINGTFGAENKYLLDEILRKEWGFQGIVVSDWWATHDRIKGILAGLDLEMPGSSPVNDQKIVDAVNEGKLDEKELDKAVKRILELIKKVEENKKQFKNKVDEDKGNKDKLILDYEKHHQLARKAAAESMVLLKNEDKILPINLEEVSSIAVLGELAEKPRYQGAGSSKVRPTKIANALEELEKYIALKNRSFATNSDIGSKNVILEYAKAYTLAEDFNQKDNDKLIEEAKELARKMDIAIIFAGIPENVESEGYDRNDLKIPQKQVDLIKAVMEVQPQTIVVLSNGAAVEMFQWINKAPAVLEGWLSGQAGAEAVVDIIFGEVNPSGKLAETFPIYLEDTPAYINYPGEAGHVNYGEGIFVGYRYYDKKNIKPLFSFGHGLSYTEFKYTNLEINRLNNGSANRTNNSTDNNTKEDIHEKDNQLIAELKFELKNIGSVSGQEIVQLYIGQDNPTVIRPIKELKGFEKIKLDPGESKIISFKLYYRDFAYYNTEGKSWIAENDSYQIMIASSSRDIRLRDTFVLENGDDRAIKLSPDTPTIDWLNDKRGYEIISKVLSQEQMKLLESPEYMYVSDKPILRLHSFSKGEITAEQVAKILGKVEK
ncbi:MAG: glycoside hydrolase family 3 C-terminal domain-containing protein [Bacillota bacterium]